MNRFRLSDLMFDSLPGRGVSARPAGQTRRWFQADRNRPAASAKQSCLTHAAVNSRLSILTLSTGALACFCLLIGCSQLHAQDSHAPTQTGREGEASVAGKTVADPKSYLAGVSGLLAREWPDNRTVNIVCHGHSVPAGYFQTPTVDTFNAYPHLLHRGLKERFPYAVLNVIVTAIGGEESESGAKRFERDVLRLHPDVVTIDYSLNDRRIGLERAAAAWRFMITNAIAADIKVILLTPTPDRRAKLNDPNDPLLQHAEQVRRLAREYDVGLVDSLALFQKAVREDRPLAELMSQSNHPNRDGHDLVARELLTWFPTSQSPQ